MAETESKSRATALRKLLGEGTLSTQDELREMIAKQGFDVTQSTISRDLRRLGAVKAIDPEGRTVYRMAIESLAPVTAGSLKDLISNIRSNGSIIVIHTSPGSASLIARHLDQQRPGGILGTLAGDDTIFVAPASASASEIRSTIRSIENSFASV